ncbi:tetratricopeptide repeat protein [Candidatus Deferrimicrobium sp.]|uniref:tetratricopeptide repeat protein n=1 Tax=Candidatus Deferrimicrobium sp. TaxID=3060586 RepID=UPI003C65B273
MILIISLFIVGPTIAGSFEEALKACDRGDHETEYRLLKPFADQGDASAQYHLGVMYGVMHDDGHGLPKDYNKAMRWYGKAADKGNAEAQCSLGCYYSNCVAPSSI